MVAKIKCSISSVASGHTGKLYRKWSTGKRERARERKPRRKIDEMHVPGSWDGNHIDNYTPFTISTSDNEYCRVCAYCGMMKRPTDSYDRGLVVALPLSDSFDKTNIDLFPYYYYVVYRRVLFFRNAPQKIQKSYFFENRKFESSARVESRICVHFLLSGPCVVWLLKFSSSHHHHSFFFFVVAVVIAGKSGRVSVD
jgi:hypothetical protein